MKDLISIVVPVYNVEDYLERAVNSIINQTYTNLEIILVDDGSTDNSGTLCDKFSKIDNRIKVIHQKNMGLSVARNIGIKHASGKYIGFVDSDDVISTKMYEMLYKAILEHNSQIAMCKYVAFREAFPIFDEIYEAKAITQDVAIKELMRDKKIRNFCWCKLFEKSLFEDIEFPVGKKFEDVGTTFKLFLKTENLVFVDMKLYGYYIRENSITGSYNINSTLDLIEMVKQRYENLLVAKPTLKEYIDMNRVNFVARYFIDISKKQKTEVLKDKDFKKKLYSELEIAKKLNSKKVRKLNNKKQKILNRFLFFSPILFCFIMKTFYKIKKCWNFDTKVKVNLFIDRKDLYLNFDRETEMIIVTGTSGSGKSYTAMELSKKYGYQPLSFDMLFDYEETRERTEFEKEIISKFKQSHEEYRNVEKIIQNYKVCNEFYDFVENEISKSNTKIIFDGSYFMNKVDFDKIWKQRIVYKRTSVIKSIYRRNKRSMKIIKDNKYSFFVYVRRVLSLKKYILLSLGHWYNVRKRFLNNCRKYDLI